MAIVCGGSQNAAINSLVSSWGGCHAYSYVIRHICLYIYIYSTDMHPRIDSFLWKPASNGEPGAPKCTPCFVRGAWNRGGKAAGRAFGHGAFSCRKLSHPSWAVWIGEVSWGEPLVLV